MYRVKHGFWDMEDKNKHVYKVNDPFPYDGRKISKKRLEELSGTNNKIGEVLIELDDEDKKNDSNSTDLENNDENTSNEDNDSNVGDENTSDEDNDSNENDDLDSTNETVE